MVHLFLEGNIDGTDIQVIYTTSMLDANQTTDFSIMDVKGDNDFTESHNIPTALEPTNIFEITQVAVDNGLSLTAYPLDSSNSIVIEEGGVDIAAQMQIIIDNSDYGWTAIPSTSEPNPMTTDQIWLVDAVYGDPIRGVKTVGSNQPTTSNLRQQHEDYSAFPGALEDVWYMEGGIETPEWVNRDDDAPFLLQHNGLRTRLGQNISPTPNEPIDMLFAFRYMPCVDNEVIGFGLRNRVTYIDDSRPSPLQTGDATTSLANVLEDNVFRVRVDGSQNWTMWKNKVQVGTGTSADISSAFIYLGSNGHPSEVHWRWTMFKNGEYTAQELTENYAAAQLIAPWEKPLWPHIPELFQNDNNQWNNTNKEWNIWLNKTPVFAGGSGIAGTYSYQWYYWDDNDPTTFPQSNRLEEHKKFDSVDGQNAVLVRAHFEASNGRGNDEIILNPGVANNIWVACKVTVRDSNGIIGVFYLTQWNQDNIGAP